jgi:type IV secretory pathway VirB4 component
MEYNKKLRRATRLVIDETQVVTNNASSARMLLDAVVTYRKFGGIVTMALQNLSRALDNPALRDMFSNCGYKCFLDQGGVDANRLAEIQELSAKEFASLAEDTPGHGVMVWGKKVILLDATMDKSNILYQHFSTNFHEGAVSESR